MPPILGTEMGGGETRGTPTGGGLVSAAPSDCTSSAACCGFGAGSDGLGGQLQPAPSMVKTTTMNERCRIRIDVPPTILTDARSAYLVPSGIEIDKPKPGRRLPLPATSA
jgi:hypothetical protein